MIATTFPSDVTDNATSVRESDLVNLRGLCTEAIDDLLDTSAYETAVAREAQDRELLIG